MVFGKRKHNLTTTLRFPHKDPFTGADETRIQAPQIMINPPISFNKKSNHVFSTTGRRFKTGPSCYYATVSSFKDESYITNANRQVGSFDTKFKIGLDGLFNLNKLRVITQIKVTCESNVISSALKKQIINNDGTNQDIQAYRTNPEGFVGFNIYKINQEQWEDIHYKNKLVYDNESLFKPRMYHHSEEKYVSDNIA